MTTRCVVCLGDSDATAHVPCARRLFGTATVPTIDVDIAKLHTLGLAMVGKTSLSGVQRKISVGIDTERTTLQAGIGNQRYILKPDSESLPHLPANEHVTMCIARAVGMEVAPCGLVPLTDGSLAYVTARFDRPLDGSKLAMEDFCQLSGRPQKDKYDGSAEELAALVRRFATEPIIEVRRLFQLLAFAWWTGNGDLHLKNIAILTTGGVHRLSPAYDLLCTRLVIPGDRLALPIGNRRDALTSVTWQLFARECGLPWRAAERVLRSIRSQLDTALDLVARSVLPDDQKADYADLLQDRTATLL